MQDLKTLDGISIWHFGTPFFPQDHEDPSSSNRPTTHGRVVSSGEDSDQAQKRLKMDNGL